MSLGKLTIVFVAVWLVFTVLVALSARGYVECFDMKRVEAEEVVFNYPPYQFHCEDNSTGNMGMMKCIVVKGEE